MIAEAEERLLCVYCHHPVFEVVQNVWRCGGCSLTLRPAEVENLKSVLVVQHDLLCEPDQARSPVESREGERGLG